MYKHGREGDQRGVTLEGAMRLYGLLHSELVGGLAPPPSTESLQLRVRVSACKRPSPATRLLVLYDAPAVSTCMMQ